MSHFPDESARSSSVAGSAGRPRPAPQLFRFGLRQLFAAVTLSTLLAALMATLPGAWPWVIGGVVAMVGAHVFGTLIGTRLRDTSRDVQLWRSSLAPFQALGHCCAARRSPGIPHRNGTFEIHAS